MSSGILSLSKLGGFEMFKIEWLFLKNPKKINLILSKCSKDLEILELNSIPLVRIEWFWNNNNNENGIWLIELHFQVISKIDIWFWGIDVRSFICQLFDQKSFIQNDWNDLKVLWIDKNSNDFWVYYVPSLTKPSDPHILLSYLLINDRQYQIYSTRIII